MGARCAGFQSFLDRRFKISERGSTVATELRGGLATFLTQAYILFANPAVLSVAGIPTSDAAIATALSSATGCIVCGLFANLPFSLAPGACRHPDEARAAVAPAHAPCSTKGSASPPTSPMAS